MTPCIQILKKSHIPHKVYTYIHDQTANSYGLEVAEKLGVSESRVFKTLVVQLSSNALVVAVIPVSSMLNMKCIATAAGVKKATMADPVDVERATGYVLGGVSPLGQKKKLQTIIDITAQDFSMILVSGGRRGLEIEISPKDLMKLTAGICAKLC